MKESSIIPEGTKLLAEWALKELFPCAGCDGTRISCRPHYLEPCGCTGEPWLAMAMLELLNPDFWGVYADHLEEQGDSRSETCRMVARLLPLDVWPDETPWDENMISGWWSMNLDKPRHININRLGFDFGGSEEVFLARPSILSSLQSLDTAILKKAGE